MNITLVSVIEGATSGIGAETARVLAKRGLRLVIPARDLKRAAEVKDWIQGESPEAEIILMEMDLSSFASINGFCSMFLSLGLPLNILVNNAGKYCKKLQLTEDKFEMTFATNYLGNFNGTQAYAQSKLANIMHAKELARRLRGRNAMVTINAVHPGVVKTGIIRDHKGLITDSVFFLASRLLKSTSQGASTTCYVALSPQLIGVSGKYFVDCNETCCSSLAGNEFEARTLWQKTHALVRDHVRETRRAKN
ncbi:hypothetical protein C4D60_Mb01t26370 [Musa balbisiana]|uniref:Uncharacterized protein n=1 Tax=Musa balbisiana TaxID=52838 RepID=A0A4S8JQW2_MUSBA|nr:hypothetical protein C4D60_Mb01t26370 [Musa balbisiana]